MSRPFPFAVGDRVEAVPSATWLRGSRTGTVVQIAARDLVHVDMDGPVISPSYCRGIAYPRIVFSSRNLLPITPQEPTT